MNENELRKLLKREVDRAGGVMRWANEKRVSMSLVSTTLRGGTPIRSTIANALGYEIISTFREKRP